MSPKIDLPDSPSGKGAAGDQLARTILDSLSAHVAILDENGFILIERLGRLPLPPRAQTILASMDTRLTELTRPFLRRLSAVEAVLTPQEIEVAALIREGRSSKEIADLMNLSLTTINFHRRNLRRKLNLRHSNTNLRTYLLSLTK